MPTIFVRDDMANGEKFARWGAFLDAIGTRGGSIIVLVGMTMILLRFLWHLMHAPAGDVHDQQIVTVITTAFAAFYGSLLTLLTGQSRQQQQGGQGGQTNGNGTASGTTSNTK